jgi:hypothetical protein
MKWLYFLFIIIAGTGGGSCNHRAGGQTSSDSTANGIMPPSPDNSQATNPSVADTAYPKKDTTVNSKDSSHSKK